MARKRSKSRKSRSTRRRRGMGAIGGQMTQLLGQVAGAVAAGFVAKQVTKALDKSSSTMDEKTKAAISAAVPVAVGFFLPKKGLVSDLATGMKIGGAAKLVSGLAGIGQIFTVPMVGAFDYRSEALPAAAGIPAIGGLSPMQIAAGV